MEAATCFLRNKNAKENVQKPTVTKPKIYKCEKLKRLKLKQKQN